MAQLNYVSVSVKIHTIFSGGIPANTDREIFVRSGESFDHAVEVKELSGKVALGYWWTLPTYSHSFRETFTFLRVEKPQDDDIQVRGTTIGGANSDMEIVIHVIYPA